MNRFFTASLVLLFSLPAVCGETMTAHDDLGREISLAQAARRILTLSPHATELVVAAGAGEQLVGIAAGAAQSGKLGALPRIGGPGSLDREALLALRPDLVIGWQSGNRAGDLDWIDRTGIALYRSEPASLRGIAESIRDIGLLSGTQAAAEESVRQFERGTSTACAHLPPQPAYVEIWEYPPMSVGGRHWINDVLLAAGYRNAFGDIDRGVFHIATEAALAQAHLPAVSTIRRHDGSRADHLADILSIPGPRLVEAIQLLCQRRIGSISDR